MFLCWFRGANSGSGFAAAHRRAQLTLSVSPVVYLERRYTFLTRSSIALRTVEARKLAAGEVATIRRNVTLPATACRHCEPVFDDPDCKPGLHRGVPCLKIPMWHKKFPRVPSHRAIYRSLCPVGYPGEVELWGQETWFDAYEIMEGEPRQGSDWRRTLSGEPYIYYKADGNYAPEKWLASNTMPEMFSRLELELLKVDLIFKRRTWRWSITLRSKPSQTCSLKTNGLHSTVSPVSL